MIKQIAWNTFKETGNIKTMMELLEMDKEALNSTEKETNDKQELKNKNINVKS